MTVNDIIAYVQRTPENVNPNVLRGMLGEIGSNKPEQTKTVALDLASGDQTVTPDDGKVLSEVSIEKPATLIANNIKKDVIIAGVLGNLEAGITPSGKKQISSTAEVDVTNYATAQVVDESLQSENIKADVSILGVNGSFYGMLPENDRQWESSKYYYCNTDAEAGSPGYLFDAGSFNPNDVQVYFTIPDAENYYTLNTASLTFGSLYEFVDNGSDSPLTPFYGTIIPESIVEADGLYTCGSEGPVSYAFYDSNNDPINLMQLQALALNTETQITDVKGTQYIIKRIGA